MKVRRVERAPDDGYDNELAPGLRATADAARLADELALSEARIAELRTSPPGLYADVAGASDAEEAAWLAFLIAYVGVGRGPDPFAAIAAARVPWATGELPSFEGVEPGPRGSYDPERDPSRTLDAYRAWASRSGTQHAGLLGEAEWEPERRFGRTYERLGLPGLLRGARFELLVSLGALGVVPLAAGSLMLGGDATDPVVSAAKRVFGIGDAINLERRAKDLAAGAGSQLGALDLALYNWGVPAEERVTMGAGVAADPARRAEIARALGADATPVAAEIEPEPEDEDEAAEAQPEE